MATHDRSGRTLFRWLLAAAIGIGTLAPLAQAQREGEQREENRERRAAQRQEQVAQRQQRAERRQQQDAHRGELEEILHGLEMGMHSLERLGRRDALDILGRIADEVRQEMRQGRRGQGREREGRETDEPRRRDGAGQREVLEIMRTAIPVLREAERGELAEMIEHAIHARALALEGRDDPEAMEIRRSAPSIGNQAEILGLAARLWAEFGHESRAEALGRLARRMGAAARAERERGSDRGRDRETDRARETDRPRERGSDRVREPQRDRPRDDRRQEAAEYVETMELARHALLEAERGEAADAMERVLHAVRARIDGRRDEEALQIYERAPGVEAQIELLRMASRLWSEFGHEERAHRVASLAERIQEGERGRRRERDERGGDVERIEAQLAELRAAMERLTGELEALRGRRDR